MIDHNLQWYRWALGLSWTGLCQWKLVLGGLANTIRLVSLYDYLVFFVAAWDTKEFDISSFHSVCSNNTYSSIEALATSLIDER